MRQLGWIVIQNHSGQQYPISVDDIDEFLVRWPSSLDLMGRGTLVEAVGRDLGSNVIEVGHIDHFEGADRSLVAPTYNSLLPNNVVVTTVDPGFNRFMNAWDYGGQRMLYGWAYPVSPGNNGIPARAPRRRHGDAGRPSPVAHPGTTSQQSCRVRRGIHDQPGDPGFDEPRPQGGLRLHAAARNQAEGADCLAACPLQNGAVLSVRPRIVKGRSGSRGPFTLGIAVVGLHRRAGLGLVVVTVR